MSTQASQTVKSMDRIVALCRRRGFIWQSSEIYGGINGFWDYGPLGAALKRNLKDAWWRDIVQTPPDGPDGRPIDIVPVDCTIIMNPKVWEASGHLSGFSDPMVDCRKCKSRFRADHVWGVVWVDFSKMREEGGDRITRHALPEYAEQMAKALEGTSSTDELSESKRAELSELIALEDYEARKALTPLTKSVVASGEDEARKAAELSKREHKALNDPVIIYVASLSEFSAAWGTINCPACGAEASLTPPREFNLMFETYIGAIRDEDAKAYLRPETAQGIFTQFWNVVDTSRVKVPFGIAQQGKAFRNEVTPRNFTFRSREFEQMEIEFFIHPSEAEEWYRYWRDSRYAWWKSIGLAGDNLQMREHDPDELAHYAKEGAGTADVEYRFPFTAPGFGELEGVAHRTDYDLRQHAEHVGKGEKMAYFDQERGERYFPHVIEPSAGADRGVLALLCEAYTPDETRPSKEFMKFDPRMAPIKAGVFPLVKKDGMPETAEKLYRQLRGKYAVEFDIKQSIGKRYARMDEAGTPWCFTVDGETANDQKVTVRDRDTQQQERVALDQVEAYLDEKIGG